MKQEVDFKLQRQSDAYRNEKFVIFKEEDSGGRMMVTTILTTDRRAIAARG